MAAQAHYQEHAGHQGPGPADDAQDNDGLPHYVMTPRAFFAKRSRQRRQQKVDRVISKYRRPADGDTLRVVETLSASPAETRLDWIDRMTTGSRTSANARWLAR